jgi:hypothetical protein
MLTWDSGIFRPRLHEGMMARSVKELPGFAHDAGLYFGIGAALLYLTSLEEAHSRRKAIILILDR